MKISDILKQKLTSRKFWMAVVGFVVPLVAYFGVAEDQLEKITTLIMAGASVLAYIFGEGLTDVESIRAEAQNQKALDTVVSVPSDLLADGTVVMYTSTDYEEAEPPSDKHNTDA